MNKNVHVTFIPPVQPLPASSRDFVILSEDSCVPAALGSAILLPRQTNLKNEMVSLFLHFYLPAAGGTQCLKIYVYMAILSELSETSIAVSFCLQSTERNFSMSWSWRMPIPIPVWKFLEMHKPILEFPMFPGMLTCSQKVVPLPLTEPWWNFLGSHAPHFLRLTLLLLRVSSHHVTPCWQLGWVGKSFVFSWKQHMLVSANSMLCLAWA